MEDNVESNGYPGLSTLYCVHQAWDLPDFGRFYGCPKNRFLVLDLVTGHLQSSGPGASNGQRLDVEKNHGRFFLGKAGGDT